MNNLTKTLLGSVALAALATAPAMAMPKHPAMHVTALHAGKQTNKTHNIVPGATHVTYTFGVYSSASASSNKQNIFGTYYKWNSAPNGTYTLCSDPKQKLKVPKKSVYGKLNGSTETYSFGCPSGQTVFRGDQWTNKKGNSGDVDTWVSTLLGTFKGPSGGKYKGTLNLDVTLNIL
jgi:hypothetical protein